VSGEGKVQNQLEEAFLHLPPERQAHSRRVSQYAGVIYAYIMSRDLYGKTSVRYNELASTTRRMAEIAALYHDIGYVLTPDKISKHPYSGAMFFREVCSKTNLLSAIEKEDAARAISEHHYEEDERIDISVVGMIVSIADVFDKIVMELVSEYPVEEATQIIRETMINRYDPEVFKALKASRAKIKKLFLQHMDESKAVPETKFFIERKATRPMELVYRPVNHGDEAFAYEASMRFRNVKDNTLPYSEVKHIFRKQSLQWRMCDYFLYEAMDVSRRFDNCKIPHQWIAVEVVPEYLDTEDIVNDLKRMIDAEEVAIERLRLIIHAADLEELEEKEETLDNLSENLKACREAGIGVMLSGVTKAFLVNTAMTYAEYPFAGLRFQLESFMDFTLRETEQYKDWEANGVEMYAEDVDNVQIRSITEDYGAAGFTGLYAGIYSTETEMITQALKLYES